MVEAHAEDMDVRLTEGARAECELICPSPISASIARQGANTRAQEVHLVAELAVHVGPIVWNGILGCQFNPNQGDTLEVRVCYQRDPGQEIPRALRSPFELVRTGLFREWAKEILDVALDAAQEYGLPSGNLVFTEAASGEVGGNVRVFKALCRLLMCAVATDPAQRHSEWLLVTAKRLLAQP